MPPVCDDWELLSHYARQRDQAAFAQIVNRYVNLVYSAAARRVGDRHLAEDVTQAVFVVLARKAGSVRSTQPLSAWLLTTVRYAAANAVKMENRRRKYESIAATRAVWGACSANPSDVILWQEVASELDDAILKLSSADRQAILLRYFEDRPLRDIADALQTTEGAAKQRVMRAIDKLRDRLERRGVGVEAIGASAFAELLASHAVQVAPAGLSHAACVAATAGAIAGASTGITIAKGVIQMMTYTKIKIAAAIVAAVTLGGTVAVSTFNTAVAADPPAKSARRAPDAQKNNAEVSLQNAPPVVVKTEPQSGLSDVDASTTEIRVTYSKDMQDGSWSWSTWGEENYPKTTGKPHYDADKRTCILPVKLEPGHTYAMWLNSNNFGNFKDAEGHKAVPYLLIFQTKP